MAFPMVYREDQLSFPEEDLFTKLGTLGVVDIRKEPRADSEVGVGYSGRFPFENDIVTVDIMSDFSTVTALDSGEAALKFVIGLQALYMEPLRVIDEGYSFDLPLKDYSDPEDLEDAINAAYEAGNEDDS